MSKRNISPANGKVKTSRGAPWAHAGDGAPVSLGLVTREAVLVSRRLRDELGRTPTAFDLSKSLGLGMPEATKLVDDLARLPRLTAGMEACLVAIARLEQHLGTSPSTREVSDAMGLSPSASRYHINRLAALGLVTPPRVRLVLAVTPWGRDILPPDYAGNASGGATPPRDTPPGQKRKPLGRPGGSAFAGRRSGKGAAR